MPRKHPCQRPPPLVFRAFSRSITGYRDLEILGLSGETMRLVINKDHATAPRRPEPDEEEANLWPFYSRGLLVTVAVLDDHGESLQDDLEVNPLHARARAAIERLGLDGSRLELAVSVFGWGSDEANGSLLGLVRVAWDCRASVLPDSNVKGAHWRVYADTATWGYISAATEDAALVLALAAKDPS